MSITLFVNGIEYDGFIAASVTTRMDTLSDTFEFSATASTKVPFPIQVSDECVVFVDGAQVLTGHVEVLQITGDSATHSVSMIGRDRTGDLLDSSISNIKAIQTGSTLQSAIQRIILDIGSPILCIDLVVPSPFTTADIIAPDPGEGAFEYMEKLARKKGVLLSSDANGNIVITQNTALPLPVILRAKFDDAGLNNIISFDSTVDTTGRFNFYRISSQLYPGSIGSLPVPKSSITKQEGYVFDADIRQGRQMVLVAESSSDNHSAYERAVWELAVRRARGNVYSCTVEGHRNSTMDLWRVNTLVNIDDDFSRTYTQMLVNGVEFRYNSDTGTTTSLELVNPDSYKLEPTTPDGATDSTSGASSDGGFLPL